MALHATILARATTHAGLSALIGARCYPLRLPDTPTFPALSYQRISSSEKAGTSGVHHPRYQFDCWGTTYVQAEAVAVQVEAAFAEHRAAGTPDYRGGQRVGQLDTYDPATGRYRVIVDMRLSVIDS